MCKKTKSRGPSAFLVCPWPTTRNGTFPQRKIKLNEYRWHVPPGRFTFFFSCLLHCLPCPSALQEWPLWTLPCLAPCSASWKTLSSLIQEGSHAHSHYHLKLFLEMIAYTPKRLTPSVQVYSYVYLCNNAKHLPPYGFVCARWWLTHSLSLSFSSSVSPSLLLPLHKYTLSCLSSFLSVFNNGFTWTFFYKASTKREWERIGLSDAGAQCCCCVSCHHHSLRTLLYLMPSGSRNNFLSCYLW